MIKRLLGMFIVLSCSVFALGEELPIVVVIPSYNNEAYYKANLDSVFAQKHSKVRVIYINDASTDHTGELVDAYVEDHNLSDRITVIHNSYNRKALMNIYKAVHMCHDDELVVVLDGDDSFAHPYVLTKINRVHTENDVWLAYAQYINWPPSAALHNKIPIVGYAAETPQAIIDARSYRWCYKWFWSGLRSFNAWFFKNIKLESLFLDTPPYQGKVLPIMYDAATLWPMMEMGGNHMQFIPDILLTRSMTPLNDFHSSGDEVKKAVRRVLRAQPAYPTITGRDDSAALHGRQQNNGAVGLIFSQDTPQDAARSLAALQACSGIDALCVVYRATGNNRKLYQQLTLQYPQVTFIQEKQTVSLNEQLLAYLHATAQRHVFIMSDQYVLGKSVDVAACIDQLERTYAYAFYLGIGVEDFAMQEKQALAARPCEQLDGDIYVWQFKCWTPRDWQQHSLSPAIYRVQEIITALSREYMYTSEQFAQVWQRVIVPHEKIGLFFVEKYC